MFSLLTNSAALVALQNLTATQSNLQKTQAQASSGLKVCTATDNAAYWQIAAKMTSQASALGAVQNDIALTTGIANVTYTALSSVVSTVSQIRNLLISAEQPGSDLGSIQSQIAAYQQQIITTANSATFAGQNWLVDNWSITGDSSYQSGYTPATQAERDAIVAAYDGTITYTQTTSTDGQFTDDWGNAVTTSYYSQYTYTWSYSNAPNELGGTDYFLNTDYSSGASDLVGDVPASIANVPVYYSAANGTSFYPISKSNLKLFDNYNLYSPSSDPTKPGIKTDSFGSYTSTAGVPYDASLPNGGIGLLAGGFSSGGTTTTVTTSPTAPSAPTSDDRHFVNGTQTDATGGNSGGSTTYLTGGISENLLTLDVTTMTRADMDAALSYVEGVSGQLTQITAALGTDIKTISDQSDFLTSNLDSYKNGVSAMVDADMNEVSTKISALQVQQQLGVQSLGIANANAAMILKLFGQ